MEQPEQESLNQDNSAPQRTLLSRIDPHSNIKGFLVFVFALIILGAGSIGIASRSFEKTKEPQPSPKPSDTFSSISPHVLVYGFWTDKNSTIKAYDMSTGKEYILAELPRSVKKVSVISPDELIYINNTDEKDHGKEVVIYSIKNKTSKVLYKAEKEFGIDDYVLSPNKRFLSDWEVKFAKNSSVLYGGRSRVYSIDLLNPPLKNLIYDEVADKPVHYPRAVKSSGEIFLDTFLPNNGLGWAYGMSVSNLTGTDKKDILSMSNGTYSTQPVLSPDERHLVFAGYDGSYGSGTSTGSGGLRLALLKPNTIEFLDTSTRIRSKLSNISNNDLYPFVAFDEGNNNIIFVKISKSNNNVTESYWYLYDSKTQIMTKITTSGSSSKKTFLLFSLSGDNMLVGKQDSSLSSIGNLGDSYFSQFTDFSILDTKSFNVTSLKLSEEILQFITLMPSSFFKNILASLPEVTGTRKSLQFQSFSLKPSLVPKRLKQQSSLSFNIPTELIGYEDVMTYYTNIANGSPLYLYGQQNLKVNLRINTSVYAFDPIYREGYNVILKANNKIEVNGGNYDRIDFDYKPAIKVIPPDYGKIVSRQNLASLLSDYAAKLGLNKKETSDLIEYSSEINSLYVFVSFFDEDSSKAMLPISFDPVPDTFINIVFYFKALQKMPEVLPPAPDFGSIQKRGAFTAVEISSIIDN